MRTTVVILIAVLLACSTSPVVGQQQASHVDVEPEPVAFLLDGASVTGAYQTGRWRYALEVFGVEAGESLHGNHGFGASLTGVEVKLERFFADGSGGFFAGVEAGVSRLDITHDPSGQKEQSVQYSTGVLGGYRWYSGLGNLYLMPLAGVSVSLDPEDVTIRGDTFETRPFTPFATVGIGWSFGKVVDR